MSHESLKALGEENVMRYLKLFLMVLVISIGAISVVPSAAHAGQGNSCNSHSCIERVYRKQCWRGNVHSCIHRASMHWRVSYSLLHSIARCESTFNERNINPSTGASGLVQFLLSTWRTTPYKHHDVLSARWNALGGAWLLHDQGTTPWVSSQGCWG